MSAQKASVTKEGIFDCVPKDWTDEQVLDFVHIMVDL